jgi:hypothetical protein
MSKAAAKAMAQIERKLAKIAAELGEARFQEGISEEERARMTFVWEQIVRAESAADRFRTDEGIAADEAQARREREDEFHTLYG